MISAPRNHVLKQDGELQIVWGVVYAPGVPDSHGDFMNAEEIRKMAYKFSQKGDFGAVDLMHNNERYGCFVVETFITREGDPDFPIVGSWAVGVHIPDPELWALVKDGTLNGFSMEALAYRGDSVVDIEVQPILTGTTEETDGHVHKFEAWFDETGQLVGGATDEAEDSQGFKHRHVIKSSVETESALNHKHRFAYIDQLVPQEAA